MTELIGWLVLAWGVIGALATASVERHDHGWRFSWEFSPGDYGRLFFSGPLIWAAALKQYFDDFRD